MKLITESGPLSKTLNTPSFLKIFGTRLTLKPVLRFTFGNIGESKVCSLIEDTFIDN